MLGATDDLVTVLHGRFGTADLRVERQQRGRGRPEHVTSPQFQGFDGRFLEQRNDQVRAHPDGIHAHAGDLDGVLPGGQGGVIQ